MDFQNIWGVKIRLLMCLSSGWVMWAEGAERTSLIGDLGYHLCLLTSPHAHCLSNPPKPCEHNGEQHVLLMRKPADMGALQSTHQRGHPDPRPGLLPAPLPACQVSPTAPMSWHDLAAPRQRPGMEAVRGCGGGLKGPMFLL